jgi:hypothetical protein
MSYLLATVKYKKDFKILFVEGYKEEIVPDF